MMQDLLLVGLALSELSADSLSLGGAVLLLVLGAGLLDGGEVHTDDGTGNTGDLGDAAAGNTVSGGLAVDTAVGLGPLVETGVLLAEVHAEALRAAEGEDGLGAQEGEGHILGTVTGVDKEVRELALDGTHGWNL